jgi:hypothetical protein
MFRLMLGLAIGITSSGCSIIVSRSIQLQSTARFPPSDRSVAYGRALTGLQGQGILVALADPVGGLIRTEAQRGWMRCGNAEGKVCSTLESSQLTVSADGVVFLQRRILVFADMWQNRDADPLTPEDRVRVQGECDGFVRYIIGQQSIAPSKPKPAPPNAPPIPRSAAI